MLNIFKIAFIAILAVAVESRALSQQSQDLPLLTVDEAVQAAWKSYPDLEVAELQLKYDREQIKAKKTSLLPSMNFYGLGGTLLTRPTLDIGQNALGNDTPATNASIQSPRKPTGVIYSTVSQPLSGLFTTQLTVNSLRLGLQIDELKLRQQKEKLESDVRQGYYELSQAQDSLEVATAALALYRETLRVAKERSTHGAVLPSELARAEAQLASAELQVMEAGNSLANGKDQLNRLLGRDVNLDFRVRAASDLKVEDTLSETLAQATAVALANRSELAEARLTVQQAELDRKAKIAEYIPSASLFVGYFTFLNVGSGLPSNIGLAGVTVSAEPWDWGRRRHEASEKLQIRKQSEVRVRSQESSVIADVNKAYRQVQLTIASFKSARLAAISARVIVREMQQKYDQEAVLLRDLLDSQNELASAEADERKASDRYWIAVADLKRAKGEE